MPRSQEAISNVPTRAVYALQLPTKWSFLLITVLSSFVSSATAANDTSSKRGCPSATFRPNIVATKEEAELKVLVPNISSLRQFVNCSDPENVRGFCIDVFENALSIVQSPSSSSTLSPNMSIHYTCFNFSSSPNATGPTYNDMVELVANGTYHAVVGDVTIGAHRLSRVELTHKYMESAVIVLAKVVQEESSPWLFFEWPFSARIWYTIVGAFIFIGIVISFFERNDHPEFTQGRISHRIQNIMWFTLETLVLLERESLRSGVARGVMLAWLFFVVLLSASYTAGLSSFFTVNNLSPPSQDLPSLRDTNLRIGYRRGSIVKDFLTQRFHIPEKNLVPIRMVPDFVSNLTKGPHQGGVVAIVDERPYANIILSALSSASCDFGITGPQLTQEGFGFGFNKERNLEAAFSIALMNLTESGCLRKLQDNAGMNATSKCSKESKAPSSKVTWKNSISLFIPLLGVLFICIMVQNVKRYFCLQRSYLIPNNEGPSVVVDDSSLHVHHPDITHRLHLGDIELHQYPYYF